MIPINNIVSINKVIPAHKKPGKGLSQQTKEKIKNKKTDALKTAFL